jgi:hypothetical protein
MTMKTAVNEFEFLEAFRRYNRFDQFGATALRSLFSYLEDLEDDTGEEMELDVIALCCDYSVDTVIDIAAAYRIDTTDMDEDEAREAVLDYLNDHTSVVDDDCDGSILYCSAF